MPILYIILPRDQTILNTRSFDTSLEIYHFTRFTLLKSCWPEHTISSRLSIYLSLSSQIEQSCLYSSYFIIMSTELHSIPNFPTILCWKWSGKHNNASYLETFKLVGISACYWSLDSIFFTELRVEGLTSACIARFQWCYSNVFSPRATWYSISTLFDCNIVLASWP